MEMETIRVQACIMNPVFNYVWEENLDIPGISFRIKLIHSSWCCVEGVNELVMK